MDEKEFENRTFFAPVAFSKELLDKLEIDVDETGLAPLEQEYRSAVDEFLKQLSPLMKIGATAMTGDIAKSSLSMLFALEAYARCQTATMCEAFYQEQIRQCEETIASLTPMVEKCPELQTTIDRLKSKKVHGVIQFSYTVFEMWYRHYCRKSITKRTWERWCSGKHKTPYGFPKKLWSITEIEHFAEVYSRKTKIKDTVQYSETDIRHNR